MEKAATERELTGALTRWGREPPSQPKKVMIAEFRNYLQNIKGYSQQTVAAYCRDVKHFARWYKDHSDDARWSTVTRGTIDAYVTWRAANGHAAATTNRALASISALYRYMQREGMEVENPCRYESRRKIAQTVPNTIPYADLEKAYEHATGAARLLLGLLVTTGMRIGEVLAMRWEDINFATCEIKVHGKGAKERVVWTLPQVLDEVADIVPAERRWGRMWYLTQQTARNMIYDALRPHTNAKQQSPHAIRHTVATRMAQAGVNTVTIAKALGHNNVKTTQRYIDAAAVDVQAALTTNNILQA